MVSAAQASTAAEQAARDAALVLDGQKSATTPARWCERGPKGLRIVSGGEMFRPRCKRRDCARCWVIRSRQTARALVLDARVETPRFCMTLTTVDPNTTPEQIRRGVENVIRRLRRRFGRIEYFAAVEFTTGRGPRSGGYRRLHLHLLIKADIETFDVIEAERIARETWEGMTGAYRIEVAALVSPGAALGYLALHHRKPEQLPPVEWRGMTERSSKGYWSSPVAELREVATKQLAAEALAHRTGLPLELAEREIELRAPARLIEVHEREGLAVVEPLGEFPGRLSDEARDSLRALRTEFATGDSARSK